MNALDELIEQIEDTTLRERIREEVKRSNKQKKFGLVFEEHLPECTPLYDVPIKRGCKASPKGRTISDIYTVLKVNDGKALCVKKDSEPEEFDINDLVCVAEFGEPIYPYLNPIDAVCNAPDSDLWHTLIEADNYHALQLLEYLYAGKVDCIYIDPPYNTGARDWKYNNDYVDSSDQYRHSKWLSMMKKRLILAKKLLNPKDSVLIVTIDEKEYLHLGCLLEELFPDASIQMISVAISRGGVARLNQFSRVDEYIFFVEFGNCSPQKMSLPDEWRRNPDDKQALGIKWYSLLRMGNHADRTPNCKVFYPIFVSKDGETFMGAGDPLSFSDSIESVKTPEGTVAIFPIKSNGDDGVWSLTRENLLEYQKKGYIRLGKFKKNGMSISYLTKSDIEKKENCTYKIDGYRQDGSIISNSQYTEFVPATQWKIASHDASEYGSTLLSHILSGKRFAFPKSIYAVHDTIRFFVTNKPNALIVDFFAGSGTTLHAVNLLNAEDGGNRRCILVTNNEVSEAEAKTLTEQGYKPGDEEWEKLGIARYVTWERTRCSIEGHDVNGRPLKGTYLGKDIPMSDGFKANAAFFKLGFLDKNDVALGRQFRELLPVLWLKAGAIGKCPVIEDDDSISDMMILPENKFAVLTNEKQYIEFVERMDECPEIDVAYIVTDSESGYRDMISGLNTKENYQLYRDYLDNFRINTSRR